MADQVRQALVSPVDELTVGQCREIVKEIVRIFYLRDDGKELVVDPDTECNGGDTVAAMTHLLSRYELIPVDRVVVSRSSD